MSVTTILAPPDRSAWVRGVVLLIEPQEVRQEVWRWTCTGESQCPGIEEQFGFVFSVERRESQAVSRQPDFFIQRTVRTTNSEAKRDIGGIDLCGTQLVLWVVRVWITSTVGDTFLCEGKHTGFVDFKSWRVTEICLIKKGLQTLYFNTLGWRLSCSWQNHHSGRMFGRSTPNPSLELWLVLSSCFSVYIQKEFLLPE